MKKLFLLLFSLFLTFFLSQKVELKKVIDSSHVFKGEISGNPITLHLDFDGVVDCHQYQHFVKGWYYYDKYKTKIPLVGIYDLTNLYLYNFENQQDKGCEFLHKEITNLQKVAKKDSIAMLMNPKERLIFERNYSDKKSMVGNLYLGNKSLTAKLFTKDPRIYRYNNYILLPNNKKINTYDIINSYGGNKLISYTTDKSENRVLLYFDEFSNFNFCGRCGASDGEKGYRVLHFTHDWNFKSYQEFPIESCLTNIYSRQSKSVKNKNILKFIIEKTLDTPSYTLTIDVKNATVTKSQ